MKQRKVTTESKLLELVRVRLRGCYLELRIWGDRDASVAGVYDRLLSIRAEIDALKWVLAQHERVLDELKCHGSLLPVHPHTQLNLAIDKDGINE